MSSKEFLISETTSVRRFKIVGIGNSGTRISEYGAFIGDIADAQDHRKMSGDLLLDPETNDLVLDDGWLWPWEKEDMRSYAHGQLLAARRRADRNLKPGWYRRPLDEIMADYKSRLQTVS